MKNAKRLSAALTPDYYDLASPFLSWFVGYRRLGGAMSRGGEFILGPLAARRFALGVADDGATVLGTGEEEIHALRQVPWNAVAFARRVQSRDWVVLSARTISAAADPAMPARLWLPTEHGKLDGWQQGTGAAEVVRLHLVEFRRNMPLAPATAPVLELPLQQVGDWA